VRASCRAWRRLAGVLPFALATSCLALLVVPGCAPPQQVRRSMLPKEFQESAKMLLAATPFKTICLEVDSVEGAEAPTGTIEALAEFLRVTCNKPVSVVTKEPIPAIEAAKMPPHFTALLHMCGPSGNDPNDTSAYVYVLLYRGRGDWERAGHARPDYPWAMFIDMATSGLSGRSQIRFALKHEAGHMMTLGSSTAHGDGAHCSNRNCLMCKAFSITRGFLGLQRGNLCETCQRDLSELKRSVQPTNLTFKGPFVVRREHGYFVAKLPGAVHVEVGVPERFDWQDTLGLLRSQLREMEANHPDAYAVLVSDPGAILQSSRFDVQTRQEYLRQQAAISAATEDTDPAVRHIARKRKAQLEERFGGSASSGGVRQETVRTSPKP